MTRNWTRIALWLVVATMAYNEAEAARLRGPRTMMAILQHLLDGGYRQQARDEDESGHLERRERMA